MVFEALATKASILIPATLAFFQDTGSETVGWDPVHLWNQMGIPGKTIVVILLVSTYLSALTLLVDNVNFTLFPLRI